MVCHLSYVDYVKRKKRNNIALVLEDVQYEWDIFVNTDTASAYVKC